MPDPKEMSGIPRPVDDLPPGAVSVRLIKGDLANNIPNHPVELRVNGEMRTVPTDEAGRAQFSGFPPNATLQAVAVVDGERLESQQFPAPQGSMGIRLMLVATDKEKEAREAAERAAPAVPGEVVIGGDSRIVIEPDEDVVRVYYLLDILNNARTPVNPPASFAFDVPSAAQSTTVMRDSSPQAQAVGNMVMVQGPFAPGSTFVQVAYALPSGTGTVEFEQVLPATLQHLAVIVQKVGDAKLTSPQIARQREMPADGNVYIAAAGEGAIPAGQPIALTITGLPHHSPVPRRIALGLAMAMALAGLWFFVRTPQVPETRAAERKRLSARREKLFQELVRLESEHRRGRVDDEKYTARREELVESLEQVYGALEDDDAGLAA